MFFCPYVGAPMPTHPGRALHSGLRMSLPGMTHLQLQHVVGPAVLLAVLLLSWAGGFC